MAEAIFQFLLFNQAGTLYNETSETSEILKERIDTNLQPLNGIAEIQPFKGIETIKPSELKELLIGGKIILPGPKKSSLKSQSDWTGKVWNFMQQIGLPKTAERQNTGNFVDTNGIGFAKAIFFKPSFSLFNAMALKRQQTNQNILACVPTETILEYWEKSPNGSDNIKILGKYGTEEDTLRFAFQIPNKNLETNEDFQFNEAFLDKKICSAPYPYITKMMIQKSFPDTEFEFFETTDAVEAMEIKERLENNKAERLDCLLNNKIPTTKIILLTQKGGNEAVIETKIADFGVDMVQSGKSAKEANLTVIDNPRLEIPEVMFIELL